MSEELKEARSFMEYIALAIDRKVASNPERKRRKLDPVLEPEKTKLSSLAVKCVTNNKPSSFSILSDLTFQRFVHLAH